MRNNKGFTLLEILIALLVFSIVSMIMVSALHNVFNSQSVTEKHAAALSKLQVALLLMSHDFEQTINRPITNAKNILEGPFIGTSDTVTFTHAGFANPLGNIARSTLQRTAYSLTNKGQLIRTIWPVLDQTQKTLPSNRVILDSVTALRFDYLDKQGKFQNNWPPADQKQGIFPRAVQVTITLNNWGTISQLYLIPAEVQPPPEKKPDASSNTSTTQPQPGQTNDKPY